MRDEDSILCSEGLFNRLLNSILFGGRQRRLNLRPGLGNTGSALRILQGVVKVVCH